MNEKRILYSECVRIYQVKESFIDSLGELGLIRIAQMESERYIEYEDIDDLEQFVRWHNDMDINPEGIEALYYVLGRVRELQSEIEYLRRELKLYKSL